jgi:GDP-mannose 6-dehydrogenase
VANIAIFGLGYVGAVTAAVLADQGFRVTGVDPNPTKVDLIERGRSPVVEPGLGDLISKAREAGNLTATADPDAAMSDANLSIICVGTPSLSNGGLDLTHVRRAAGDVARRLDRAAHRHTVVVRSTMLPGSMEDSVIPVLEETSGLQTGSDFGVVFHPEFLREGSSLHDYANPPFVIVGTDDQEAARAVLALYEEVTAETLIVPIKVAELVKYASNAFHGLKVTFANEIGNLAAAQGLDGRDVMDILVRDTKLNISPAYLKPGFAFGGSCLPKDLRALRQHARNLDVDTDLIDSILPSNARQIDRAFDLVAAGGRRPVGVLGLSFKSGTDDLRESPVVELVERLIGKGFPVRVFDPNVALADLIGSNREYIQAEIPHISSVMAATAEDAVAEAEVLVVAGEDPGFDAVLEGLPERVDVVDLVGTKGPVGSGNYWGICW